MLDEKYTGNGKVVLLAGGGKIYRDIAARFVRGERLSLIHIWLRSSRLSQICAPPSFLLRLRQWKTGDVYKRQHLSFPLLAGGPDHGGTSHRRKGPQRAGDAPQPHHQRPRVQHHPRGGCLLYTSRCV